MNLKDSSITDDGSEITFGGIFTHPQSVSFHADGGRRIFTITPTGEVIFGEDINLDDAAIAFWKLVAHKRISCSPEINHKLLTAAGHNFCWKCGIAI